MHVNANLRSTAYLCAAFSVSAVIETNLLLLYSKPKQTENWWGFQFLFRSKLKSKLSLKKSQTLAILESIMNEYDLLYRPAGAYTTP